MLEPSQCFTTCQFTHHVGSIQNIESWLLVINHPLLTPDDVVSFSIFTKNNYCISLSMKHDLEMFVLYRIGIVPYMYLVCSVVNLANESQ